MRLARWLPRGLGYRVPDRPFDTADARRRRRRVVAATCAGGASLLGASLSRRPDSTSFYVLTAATAVTWTGGARASGTLHRGWLEAWDGSRRRPVLVPVATGAAAFGVLYGAALVARRIPVLDRAVRDVLEFAEHGASPLVWATTLGNGAAEECFFRGALYAAAGPHPVVVSTLAYTATTAASRNASLVLAAAGMGTLFGLQRRATGGIQAPLITHLVWSALVLRFLPPLFREEPRDVSAT